MNNTALKYSTLADLLNLGPETRCELIDGQILEKSASSGEHSNVVASLISEIRGYFHRPRGPIDSNGWWIQTDVHVHYPKTDNIFSHDLAGWRRDRVHANPKGFPIHDRPDWVCEVSWTTWRKDTRIIPESLISAGVPYYWVADVEKENLLVFKLVEGHYSLLHSLFRSDTCVRIPPFDAVELNVDVLFGADHPE